MIEISSILMLTNLRKSWLNKMKLSKKLPAFCLLIMLLSSWNGIGLCASFSNITEAFEQDFNRLNPEKVKDHFISLVENLSGMRINRSISIEYRPRGDAKNEWCMQELERNNLKDKLMVQGYEYILKRFHLLDPGKSLKEILMTYYDDIYGLYDPHKKSIVFMEGINKQAIPTTLFHELMHAAQDSTVDLIKYQEQYCNTLDGALAASALIEGQATALELIVQIEKNLEGKTRKEIIKYMLDQIGDKGAKPLWAYDSNSLNTLRTFPYSFGLIFVLQRIVKDDSDFSGMFEKVPVSTEQVLHVDKFQTNEQPLKSSLGKKKKKISSLPDVTIILDTSLGEYYMRQIFNNILKAEADAIDKSTFGWGGDRVFVIQSEKALFLIWDTLWDNGKDAEEFYQKYLAFSKKRFKVDNLPPNDLFDASYIKDDTRTLIKRQDSRVLIMEGQITPAILERLKKILDL